MTVYSKGLFIGRFQPFHKGHLYLLHYIKEKTEKLVIGIGSANVFDEDNPFTYEERKEMIEKVIVKEKLQKFITKIVPLNDYYDDDFWFRNTLNQSGRIDVIIGNNEWPNRIFETRGYIIWRAGFFKRYIYEGEKIRKLIHQKKEWKDRVPGYLASYIRTILAKHRNIPFRFQHVGIGGTFDHFHKGHKKLLDTAFTYGKEISIGITTEAMHQNKKYLGLLESYEERKKSVTDYLKKNKLLSRASFFPLSDIYGRTSIDGTIEAVVVSKETYSNAIKINKLRQEKSLPELKIVLIKDVKGTDGKLISSERIRRGEIDRKGNSYWLLVIGYLEKKQKLVLPEELREELRKPLGKVIQGKENELEETVRKSLHYINIMKSKPAMVIAVGDIIANSLEKVGFIPDVKIIDYRSRRKKISNYQLPITNKIPNSKFQTLKRVVNKPGTISKKATSAIKRAIHTFFEPSHPKGVQPQTVVIDGEEDLLALPAILFAPLNSIVLYGQIDLGVVIIEVTEEKKKQISRIVEKFN